MIPYPFCPVKFPLYFQYHLRRAFSFTSFLLHFLTAVKVLCATYLLARDPLFRISDAGTGEQRVNRNLDI